jgi:hypothetical protein
VFSLGRGAIEAMACGRAVYVYDRFGADGWVTPGSIDEIASCTFSGKRYGRRLTARELVGELKRYDPGMGAENRRLAEDRYDIDRYLPVSWGSTARPARRFDPVCYRSLVRRSKWR